MKQIEIGKDVMLSPKSKRFKVVEIKDDQVICELLDNDGKLIKIPLPKNILIPVGATFLDLLGEDYPSSNF